MQVYVAMPSVKDACRDSLSAPGDFDNKLAAAAFGQRNCKSEAAAFP